MSREEQIQRISLNRDDIHRELEHKESQLLRLDSDLAIAKEERRKADDVVGFFFLLKPLGKSNEECFIQFVFVIWNFI